MALPEGLREDQIKKAVAALLKHIAKQQARANDLLEEDELLYLVSSFSSLGVSQRKSCRIAAHYSAHRLIDGTIGRQTIALKKTPQAPRRDKPLRIPLPHPLYDFEGAEVCLLVKDHKGGAWLPGLVAAALCFGGQGM